MFCWTPWKLVYTFPTKILLRLLSRIEEERVLVILITPNWLRRTCCTDWLGHLADEPLPLQNRPDLRLPFPSRFSVTCFNTMALETEVLKNRDISNLDFLALSYVVITLTALWKTLHDAKKTEPPEYSLVFCFFFSLILISICPEVPSRHWILLYKLSSGSLLTRNPLSVHFFRGLRIPQPQFNPSYLWALPLL